MEQLVGRGHEADQEDHNGDGNEGNACVDAISGRIVKQSAGPGHQGDQQAGVRIECPCKQVFVQANGSAVCMVSIDQESSTSTWSAAIMAAVSLETPHQRHDCRRAAMHACKISHATCNGV
eukprot:295307-Chlamydomonas_euryale.AAC.1